MLMLGARARINIVLSPNRRILPDGDRVVYAACLSTSTSCDGLPRLLIWVKCSSFGSDLWDPNAVLSVANHTGSHIADSSYDTSVEMYWTLKAASGSPAYASSVNTGVTLRSFLKSYGMASISSQTSATGIPPSKELCPGLNFERSGKLPETPEFDIGNGNGNGCSCDPGR